ncbi:hypothetical protein DWB77_04569 [Streptomyces hundungensis]|uniref:Integral membrane protein n=1 Tax=Streptomyces hundungensis TaxID=1077946 RepID=A0A387HEX4_9ACTN|nr:hypothetical protein [Streptomyces hundungensis]AYG82395.1 hypothetical protein DWB77_04569 [Streptomyces hundungensis]
MHGPGYGPPQPRPSGAGQIVLRVLFALVPLVSIGMLSWAALLRLAIVTRRRAHWVLFWVQLALCQVAFGFIMRAPDENDWRMDVGMIGLLGLAVAGTGFYLYADIRHASRPPLTPGPFGRYAPAGYGPPHIPATTAPRFGPYANPYAETPMPAAPPSPVAPTPAPPSAAGAPRIDQVRAELDELSQYLRKGTGGGDR